MFFGSAIRNIQVRYYIDHDPDYRKAVFVSGMGRSGTTWLAELINYRNEYRFIFEPFDPVRVAMSAGFAEHQYLREDDDRHAYLAPAGAILRGYVRDPFVDQHNRKLFVDRRIVKEVHANLFLRWLYRQFSGVPLILIVRNPFAVAASRSKTDEDIDLEAAFLSQRQLVDDHLRPFVDLMRACASPFERQIAAWCVENGVPLAQFQPHELCVITYEQLCVDPESALRTVFAHLGKPFDTRVLRGLARPSQTTLSPETLSGDWRAGPKRIIGGWRDRLPAAQIARGREILAAFGLDHLYEEDVPDAGSWLPVRMQPGGRGGKDSVSLQNGQFAAGGA